MHKHQSPNERVLDMAALKALAHPLRIEILDALSGFGPATASMLAERLGESSGATSYHLRQLERHGLVEEVADRGTGRERWWRRVPRPIAVDSTDFSPESPEFAASELITNEWHRTRSDRLAQFNRFGLENFGKDWVNASSVSTANLPLTKEQLHDLVGELFAVLDGYIERYRHQTTPGARPVQVHLDAFPLIGGREFPADVSTSEEA